MAEIEIGVLRTQCLDRRIDNRDRCLGAPAPPRSHYHQLDVLPRGRSHQTGSPSSQARQRVIICVPRYRDTALCNTAARRADSNRARLPRHQPLPPQQHPPPRRHWDVCGLDVGHAASRRDRDVAGGATYRDVAARPGRERAVARSVLAPHQDRVIPTSPGLPPG